MIFRRVPQVSVEAPTRALPFHRRIFFAGIVILITGLLAAATIYAFSADAGSGVLDNAGFDRRGYEFQLERMGGMAMVYAARFNEWLGSLWHGRRLAFTVGVLATALALLCFWVAGRLAASLPRAVDDARRG